MPERDDIRKKILADLRNTWHLQENTRRAIRLGLKQTTWAMKNISGSHRELALKQLVWARDNIVLSNTLARFCEIALKELIRLAATIGIKEVPAS